MSQAFRNQKQVLCITLNPAIDMSIGLDVLKVGAVNRAQNTQTDAAGKGLNAAQILSDLGMNTVASGFLGADNDAIFKQLFEMRAAQSQDTGCGMLQDAFVRVSGETRTNIKITDYENHQGRTTDINGMGFVVNESDKLELIKKITELAAISDAVLIAGSLPKGFEPIDFTRLLDAVFAVNKQVAVDVSGQALKLALAYPLWLAKPNEEELHGAYGEVADTLDLQLKLFEKHQCPVENMVISMGEHGVHWIERSSNKIYKATPPSMTVVSTVGAGDTMMAAMIYGLLNNQDDEEILANATALSAHAVTILGFGVPSQDRLAELSQQVTVTRIN